MKGLPTTMTLILLLSMVVPSMAAWGDDVASVVGLGDDDYYPEQGHFIQFGLDNAVTLAWAHSFMDTRYLRYGVDMYVVGRDYDRDQYDGNDAYMNDNSETANLSFTVNLDYYAPFQPNKRVRLYWAAGPSLRYRYDQYKDWTDSFSSDSQIDDNRTWSEYSSHDWSVGARGLLGAEFAVTSHAAVFFEAGASAMVRISTQNRLSDPDYYDGEPGYEIDTRYEWGEIRMTNLRYGLTFRY